MLRRALVTHPEATRSGGLEAVENDESGAEREQADKSAA